MKAKSRKRLLISSIAMLLVAMIALGTATFAWFTSSTQATASGINVSTIKSSELVISKSDLQWNTTLNYNETSSSYTPVSSANGTSWFEANAKVKTNFAKDTDASFGAVTSAANHYYTEALNIGNAGDADVEHIQIRVSGLTNSYARLAIFEVTANNGTTPKDSTNGTFAKKIYDTEGDTYNAASGTGASAVTEITATDGSAGITINVSDLAGTTSSSPTVGNKKIGGIAYYKFYVWFEGQDEDCVDANAGTSFGNLTFTVSGDTKTTA